MTNPHLAFFLFAGGSLCVLAPVRCWTFFELKASRIFLPNQCDVASGWCLGAMFGLGEVGWWESSGWRLSPVHSAEYDIRRMSLTPGLNYYPGESLGIKRMKSRHHLCSVADRIRVTQNPVDRIPLSSQTDFTNSLWARMSKRF